MSGFIAEKRALQKGRRSDLFTRGKFTRGKIRNAPDSKRYHSILVFQDGIDFVSRINTFCLTSSPKA
jgi:hypothetical protein